MKSNKDRPRFKYRRPSADDLEKRASQSGGLYDQWTKGEYKLTKIGEGSHKIRILPPTWEDARHYGFDVWMHSGIGADNQTYLCARKMKEEPCPICEELSELQKAKADDKQIRELRPYRRVLVWAVIRRKDADDEGPALVALPITIDKDLAAQAVDSETGEVLFVDDPDRGYDVSFKRTGTGRNTTEYVGVKIARQETPISDSEKEAARMLDYITEHPIPETLNWYDYDYIQRIFSGKVAARDKRDDDDDGMSRRDSYGRSRKRDEDEEEEAPRKKLSKREEPEEEEEEEPPRKKLAKPRDEIDDEDEDLDEDKPSKTARKARDEDEDEDEPPPRKKLSKRDEEEEEEEEEAPRKKLAKRDEDEEEEERPAAKKGPPWKKNRAEEDEEEEEEERPRKKVAAKDDDEDEEEEERPRKRASRDEEEEEAPRKSSSLRDRLKQSMSQKRGA